MIAVFDELFRSIRKDGSKRNETSPSLLTSFACGVRDASFDAVSDGTFILFQSREVPVFEDQCHVQIALFANQRAFTQTARFVNDLTYKRAARSA